MNWLSKTIGSSVGKKLLMAITGLSFCGFLTTHLIGNLTLYGGSDLFEAYVHHLHSLGALIPLAEAVLLALFAIHVVVGIILFLKNLRSRPVKYAVNKTGGGRTLGSGTMPYTGLLILAFILFHLVGFKFADHETQTVWQIVTGAFANPVTAAIYVAAMIIAAVHVSHGLWSAFHTIGAAHPKYTPVIKGLSIIFCLIVGIGYGFIPVYLLVSA